MAMPHALIRPYPKTPWTAGVQLPSMLATAGMPVVPLEVRRALYRRGGRDRALAERLHRGCGGAAA